MNFTRDYLMRNQLMTGYEIRRKTNGEVFD